MENKINLYAAGKATLLSGFLFGRFRQNIGNGTVHQLLIDRFGQMHVHPRALRFPPLVFQRRLRSWQ